MIQSDGSKTPDVISDTELNVVCIYVALMGGGMVLSGVGAAVKSALRHDAVLPGLVFMATGICLMWAARETRARSKLWRNVTVVLGTSMSWLICAFLSQRLGVGVWGELPTCIFLGTAMAYFTGPAGRAAFSDGEGLQT